MCSICGFSDFKNGVNNKREYLEKMGATLSHRGPDQKGVFMTDCVGFQHNRLSIIDIENGIQPMTAVFEGKSYTIIYNGEIYNAPELSDELKGFGVKFKTRCDTEVVLYSYIIFKEKCPEKLNGIFAFAVYDDDKRSVFLCRDRFGIKPFFYTIKDGALVFASEIKALFKYPGISPEIDKYGMWQLLFLMPAKINGTGVFKGIHELKPAQCGYFDSDGLRLWEYWRLEAKENTESRADILEHTRYLLTDAIKRQLVSDAPLCTFLSGGLDSSIITSVAAKEYEKSGMTLSTYSFEYEDNKKYFKSTLFQPQGDDEYAVYLADYLKTDHNILTAPIDEVANKLTDAVYYRDLPGQADIDSSLLYFCSLVKNRHTVGISGECADEIFGGYPWFYREEMLKKPFFPFIHDPFARIMLFDSELVKTAEGYDLLCEIYRQDMESCPVLDSDSDVMKRSRLATWLSVSYFMTSLLDAEDKICYTNSFLTRCTPNHATSGLTVPLRAAKVLSS